MRKRADARASEKLVWRRSFPTGVAPAAYFAGGKAAGSPGGGRRKEALLTQGCRIHRACRWIRISAWRAAALQTSDGWCGADGSGVPEREGAVKRVSCVLRTLETLARAGCGVTCPALEREARERLPRRGQPQGAGRRVSCAARALETLARGLRALRAALAWLAPEARDRPRIRILKRAGAATDELRAWPATTDGHHFGVAPPLWVVRRHRRERNERRARPAPTATIERP